MVTKVTIWASGSCLCSVSECADRILRQKESAPIAISSFTPLTGRGCHTWVQLLVPERCGPDSGPPTDCLAPGALRQFPVPRGLTGMVRVHGVLGEEQPPSALPLGPLGVDAVLQRVRRVPLAARSIHGRAGSARPAALATPALCRRAR